MTDMNREDLKGGRESVASSSAQASVDTRAAAANPALQLSPDTILLIARDVDVRLFRRMIGEPRSLGLEPPWILRGRKGPGERPGATRARLVLVAAAFSGNA